MWSWLRTGQRKLLLLECSIPQRLFHTVNPLQSPAEHKTESLLVEEKKWFCFFFLILLLLLFLCVHHRHLKWENSEVWASRVLRESKTYFPKWIMGPLEILLLLRTLQNPALGTASALATCSALWIPACRMTLPGCRQQFSPVPTGGEQVPQGPQPRWNRA